jgi:hypothetical protein
MSVRFVFTKQGTRIVTDVDAPLIGKATVQSDVYHHGELPPEKILNARILSPPVFKDGDDWEIVIEAEPPPEGITNTLTSANLQRNLMLKKGRIPKWQQGFIENIDNPKHMICRIKNHVKGRGKVRWPELSDFLTKEGYAKPEKNGAVAECLFLLKQLSYIRQEGHGDSKTFIWIGKKANDN